MIRGVVGLNVGGANFTTTAETLELVKGFVHDSVARVLQVPTRLAQFLPETAVAKPSGEDAEEG